MNKSITHYIHYSYENFKALVDSSKASWEAVETVSEGKKGKHPAAGVHPEPDLDDFGFPTLQASLFQGHHNDAPASECALAVKAQPIQLTSSDLIPKKLGDETYGMSVAFELLGCLAKNNSVLQYGARRCMPQTHRGPRTSEEPIESTPQRLSFKPRGRPRKVPRTGLPANIDSMTPKEIKKFANLQQAAIKYDVLKIEKEIDRRVDAGEDPATALDVVLREVADEHAQLELPPSLAAKAVRVRSTMPGAKEHKPILPDAVLTDTAGRVEMISAKATRKVGRANGKKKQPPYEYMPSVAAHSWLVVPQAPSAPTRLSESKPKAGPNLSCMRRGSIDVAYLPSIAAHTQPIIQSPALALNIAATRKQKSAQRLIREKRKISQDLSAVPYPQLSQNTPNNLADHSLPARKKHKRSLPPESREDAAFGHIPTGDVSLKRKRSIIESSESNKRITIEYLPSIATHAQKIFRPIEPLLGGIISNQPNSRRPVRGYVRKNVNRVAIQEASTRKVPSGRTESEIKNYKKQLNDIKRPEDGIFIGGRTTVYRKGGNGPRRSQFAIFKSHRLQNFYWFQKETSSPEQTLGTSTNDISRAYISTNTLFPPRLDPQDDLQLGSSTPITSLPCASPAGKVGSDSGSPHGPRSREKEKPIESSAETHLPPSPDRAFTSSHETSRSSAIHSIQEPSPFNELSETIYPLPNSASKRRPLEIVHESVPDHSLCVTEGLVNDLTGPLSGDFHLLSHPPRSASMPSSMSVNRPMPEGAEKMLGKAMGPPESARIASGSCNSGGLAIDQGPLQDGPSRSPFLADTYLANASLEKVVQTRPQAKVSTKMSLTGGSVGFLRRKIIMDIVQKCGGAFPSDRELLYPFVYAWQKEGKLGTPEKHTVTAACKSLYASGKLRQLYFSFKDNKGLMVTRPMMTVQGISPTDPKVKEIQQKVIDIYPRPYIPDEAEVSEDVRAKFSSPQVYGTSRTFPRLEIDHEARVQLQHKPQYVQRIEYLNSARSRIPNRIVTTKFGEVTEKPSEESTSTINDLSDDEAMINSEQPHVRAGPDNTRRFIRRPDLDPGLHIPVRKVERLASIRRPPPARTAQLSTGQNRVTAPKNSILSAPSQHVQPLGRPSGFNTTYGFGKYSPQRQVRYSALEDSPENYFNPSFRAFQPGAIVLEELPGEILQPELNVTGAHPPQSGLSPKEAGTLTSKRAVSKKRVKPYLPSIIAHTQPYPRPIRKYRTKQYLPSIAAHAQPICKPITTKRRNNKPFSKLWSGGNLVSSRTDSRSLSPAPSQSYRFSDGLLSAVSADVSRIKMVYALNTSQTLSIDPWYAHQQMSTIMDPDHRSHSVTGTFFTVFQEPKKFGRRTQTTPHKGGSKADQVYSNWGRCGQPSMDWITPDQSHRRVGFEIEVDNMLCWELEMEDFDPAAFADRSFVNLKLQHPHRLSTNAPICMDRAVNVSFSNIDGRILYKPFTPSVVRKPKVDRKVVSKGIRRVPPVVPAVQAVKLAKRKRQKEPKERFMSRRLTSLPDGQGFGCSKPSGEISSKFDADGRPVKLRRIRGPQLLQSLGEEGERRLIFATLVIRTLTGGLERHIDWVLVARLFAPKFDQMFIQNRWNAVLNKWRFEYERLYIEFQDMFTQAYEDGVVPPIDYDNLENYDWAWLVDWTMKNIEAPSKALPDLPAERSKFDERFTTKETNENNLHVFYETDGVQNLPSRTKSLLKQSYVYPLQGKRLFPPAEESEELAVAKSWIRANIITPNASYNSEFARERLLKFNEATIELGLKELMASRVLSQQNKGRLVPGRNYNISQHVLDRLKKNLEIRNFLCAAAYKRHLDRELEEKDAVDFSPTADDGIVLAVLNMQAHGRVEIRPKNPPMNKFGLTDGGYETRKMDKSRLNFTCEIRLKDTYITGNPLFPLPPPPCQHLGVPMSKIPLWYDIHDKLMPEVWDKVLAATVAILALRPGIDAQKIEKTMRPALEVWELELVLEWMVVAKAAKKAGRGYMVDEWWWLCMDHEEEGEGARTKIGGETNISADEN